MKTLAPCAEEKESGEQVCGSRRIIAPYTLIILTVYIEEEAGKCGDMTE